MTTTERDPSELIERAFLGAILLEFDPETAAEQVARLRPRDFGHITNRNLFEVISGAVSEGAPTHGVSILTRAADAGAIISCGGPDGIQGVMDWALNAQATSEQAADAVVKQAHRRDLAKAAQIALDVAEGGASMETSTAQLRHILNVHEERARKDDDHSVLASKALFDLIVTDPVPSYGVGLRATDDILGGFSPGRLYVVGARTGEGKTTSAVFMMEQLMRRQGGRGLFVSCEMIPAEMGKKFASVASNRDVAGELSRASDEGTRAAIIGQSVIADELFDSLLLDYARDMRRVTAEALRLKAEPGGLRYVVVDYIQAMTTGEYESRTQDVGAVSRACKRLATEHGLVVIAASQLNRSSAGDKPRRPVLTDLRDSGEIEQDADAVILLHRDGEDATTLTMDVAKNRWGLMGSAKTKVVWETGRFGEWR